MTHVNSWSAKLNMKLIEVIPHSSNFSESGAVTKSLTHPKGFGTQEGSSLKGKDKLLINKYLVINISRF